MVHDVLVAKDNEKKLIKVSQHYQELFFSAPLGGIYYTFGFQYGPVFSIDAIRQHGQHNTQITISVSEEVAKLM